MKLALDMLGGCASIGTIIGFALRKYKKDRRLNHAEYIAELERQNKELDKYGK